jgi:hypothetical protein
MAGNPPHHFLLGRVEGTSMMPTLPPGSEVLFSLGGAAPQPGEVVALRSPSGFVSHRVVAVSPGWVVTQGDNRPTVDGRLPAEMVAGRAIFVRTPNSGWQGARRSSMLGIGSRLGRWFQRTRFRLEQCLSVPEMQPTESNGLDRQRLGTDLVLHDRATGAVHLLNETAAQVWESATMGRDAQAIARELKAIHPSQELEGLLADVTEILRDFTNKGLIKTQGKA